MANLKIPGIGVHHLALSSAKFDESVKFYTEGLGFKCVAAWGEGVGRAVMLDIGNGTHMEIFANGTEAAQQNARFPHYAFSVVDTDAAYFTAISAGAKQKMVPTDVDIPSNPVLPVRIAFVYGPDGEELEFFHVR